MQVHQVDHVFAPWAPCSGPPWLDYSGTLVSGAAPAQDALLSICKVKILVCGTFAVISRVCAALQFCDIRRVSNQHSHFLDLTHKRAGFSIAIRV